MATARARLEDLKAELEELSHRNARFSDDNLFILWFLKAYVTDSESAAGDAVVGVSNDKGVDAVFIDDSVRAAFIVQGKYRQTVGKKNESRTDVMDFARLASVLCEPDTTLFKQFTANADPHVADRLKLVRKKVLQQKYRLWLYYVSLGKCSNALKTEAKKLAQRTDSGRTDMEVLDGPRVMILLRDYLDGVAPPIPTLDLEMEKGPKVAVNGVLQRFDIESEIESWAISMRGDAVADLFEFAGPRLFARNIRGFLGQTTAVNEGMIETLDREPEKFFYYNNGITIVCDDAKRVSEKGRDILRVSNPQVINGQQTTRMLSAHASGSRTASVIVKVIKVPKDPLGGDDEFDALVSNIVAGTNWQNQIRSSDLRSNDRRQVDIERALRKLGYIYLRKRQSKAEAKRLVGGNRFPVIRKEELAQAVAGCDLDPVVVRSGKEKLFEEELYNRVFPNSDPNFYLPRYRLMREVTWHSRGFPERGYAKWLVLNFMWAKLEPLVRKAAAAESFRVGCERAERRVVQPLSQSINRAFDAALRYYRLNRGKGKKAIDVSTFFRSREKRHKEFAAYWQSNGNRFKASFDRAWARFEKGLKE